jgi:Tfp pilus assembly protein PilO
MENILAWKIMPRLMMLVMTVMYIRCIEWALTQPDLSTQQSALISVVAGAMTGAFAVWLGSEK